MRSSFFHWRKDLGSADLLDTLNMFVKSTKNLLEAFEKKFQFKKWVKMKLKIGLEYSDKTPFIGLKLFFQMPLENFL